MCNTKQTQYNKIIQTNQAHGKKLEMGSHSGAFHSAVQIQYNEIKNLMTLFTVPMETVLCQLL